MDDKKIRMWKEIKQYIIRVSVDRGEGAKHTKWTSTDKIKAASEKYAQKTGMQTITVMIHVNLHQQK